MAHFTLADGGDVYVNGVQVHVIAPVPGAKPAASYIDGNARRVAVLGTPLAIANAFGQQTVFVKLTDVDGNDVRVNPIQTANVTPVPASLVPPNVGPCSYIEEATGARLVVQGDAATVATALGIQ